MDVFDSKNKIYHKQFTKLGGNKVLQSRPHGTMPILWVPEDFFSLGRQNCIQGTMFIASFSNFKSHALSHDRLMPHAEMSITAQNSH